MCRWALVLLVLWPGAAAAQRMLEGSVAGREDKGFGRIVFSFPEPVTATARAAGGVLIVSFDRPVRLSVEKLAASMEGIENELAEARKLRAVPKVPPTGGKPRK